LAQFYANFNKLSEEVKEIFSITTDVKEMQKRWNKALYPECDWQLYCQITWGYRLPHLTWSCSFRVTKFSHLGDYRFAFAVQDRTTRGRGHESNFGARGRGGGRSEGQARGVIYCYCKESGYNKYNYSLLQGKQD